MMNQVVPLIEDKVLEVIQRKLEEYIYVLEFKTCVFYKVRIYNKDGTIYAMFYEGYLPVYHVRYTIEQGQVVDRQKIYC